MSGEVVRGLVLMVSNRPKAALCGACLDFRKPDVVGMQECLWMPAETLEIMTPSKAVSAFEEFVEGHGSSLLELTVRTGIAEMLLFYQTVSPTGCTNENGDMLLFQWGTYDWGNGKSFEINVTRQFIELDAEDDDAISQLQLTFKFPPDEHTTELGSGNRWCNLQSEIDAFREFILSNSAFRAVADSDPPDVSLHHEYV